jgi:hypothetical protein
MLISTIAPAGDDEDDDDERNVSLGGLLARALTGKSPKGAQPKGAPNELAVSCHAAAVLRHALEGNTTAKARILTIPLEMPKSSTEPPELLLPRIMRFLSAAVRSSSSQARRRAARGSRTPSASPTPRTRDATPRSCKPCSSGYSSPGSTAALPR